MITYTNIAKYRVHSSLVTRSHQMQVKKTVLAFMHMSEVEMVVETARVLIESGFCFLSISRVKMLQNF